MREPAAVMDFASPSSPLSTHDQGIEWHIANLCAEIRDWSVRTLVLTGYGSAPSPDEFHARRAALATRQTVHELIRQRGLQLLEIDESCEIAHYVAHGCPIPVVIRLRGPWFMVGAARGVPRDRAFRRRVHLEGLALRAAVAISAPAHDVLVQTLTAYGLEPFAAAVIPPAIAPVEHGERWRMDTCDRNRLLFVGRFDRPAGADVVVRAFARLVAERPELRLTLVEPEAEFLNPRCQRWKPGPCTRAGFEWLGPQPASVIAALRRRSFVTMVGSRYETTAETALEALASGCPLVATAAEGLTEIVRDGDNGLMCRPGDASDLAQKVARLLDDPLLAARLGRQAALDMERRFNPAMIARYTLDFYEHVVRSRQDATLIGPN